MQAPFDDILKEIADNMGISLYQRFTLKEASLFLRIGITELRKIIKQGNLNYIKLASDNIEFFGYQLLEFCFGQYHPKQNSASQPRKNTGSNHSIQGTTKPDGTFQNDHLGDWNKKTNSRKESAWEDRASAGKSVK